MYIFFVWGVKHNINIFFIVFLWRKIARQTMGARKYVLWRRGAARRLEWRTALRQAEPVVGCSRVVKTGTPAAQFSGGQTRRCASSRVCSGENSSLTHSGKERLCVVWTAGRNLTALLVEGRRSRDPEGGRHSGGPLVHKSVFTS